jgi:hypothetical protein
MLKMNVTVFYTKDYEKMATWAIYENKPNSNPIYPGLTSGQAGSEAKMTAAATSRKTWKIMNDYSTIALQSLKTMNRGKYE